MPYNPAALGLNRWRSRAPQLPTDVLQVLGQITVHWAQVEFDLQGTYCEAAGVPYPVAQLTFKAARATEKLAFIGQVLEVQGIRPPQTKRLMRYLTAAQRDRNILAHSTWVEHPETGRLHVRAAAGQWPENHQMARFGMVGKTSRRVVQEARPFTIREGRVVLKPR